MLRGIASRGITGGEIMLVLHFGMLIPEVRSQCVLIVLHPGDVFSNIYVRCRSIHKQMDTTILYIWTNWITTLFSKRTLKGYTV
jgi:hypothetical protein